LFVLVLRLFLAIYYHAMALRSKDSFTSPNRVDAGIIF
jgi:hypothetical protein